MYLTQASSEPGIPGASVAAPALCRSNRSMTFSRRQCCAFCCWRRVPTEASSSFLMADVTDHLLLQKQTVVSLIHHDILLT